jgi:hypothetical protein
MCLVVVMVKAISDARLTTALAYIDAHIALPNAVQAPSLGQRFP